MNKEVVITYFEPFGGRDTNTSKEVVSKLDEYFHIEIPVSWSRVEKVLISKLTNRPKYLFLIGEAGSYQNITVELIARNLKKGKDNDLEEFDLSPISQGEKEKLTTSLIFNNKELEVNLGVNAGQYLCNYIYYSSLRDNLADNIVFIHLPYPRDDLTINDMRNKLKEIIRYVLYNQYELEIGSGEDIFKKALKVREEIFIDEQKFTYEEDEIDQIATHFILFKNKKIAGVCRVYIDESQVYHVGRVAVKKEFRHQGIGSTILKEVEKYLYKNNAKEIILGAQVVAKDFYKRSGYSEYGDLYFDESVPHIKMKKELI